MLSIFCILFKFVKENRKQINILNKNYIKKELSKQYTDFKYQLHIAQM